jgi:carbamoyltransferase
MSEWILALGGSDHDFSATLAHGSEIRVAVEQERLSRRKHSLSCWYENPVKQSVDYCLAAEGVSLADIGTVVASDSIPARVRRELRDHQIQYFPHHLCHAASAYMMVPAGAKAAVLVYDGFGSIHARADGGSLENLRETFSLFLFGPGGITRVGQTVGRGYVEEDEFPIGVADSIGMLYELVTAFLGYDIMDSGKTMGLSSHGTPRYLDVLERFAIRGDDPSNCFRCATDDPALHATLERILLEGHGSFAVRADLAASLQTLVNQTLLHCARFFDGFEFDYLCISGGCGLNTVANSFLVENSPFNVPIIIPPHCGDAGLGLGALWLERFERNYAAPALTFRRESLSPALSRPGRRYSREECRTAAHQFYPRLALDPAVTSACEVAAVLARGEIVGVVNGGSEIGPRALGGRSIFADPRSVMMREKINREIKRREPFRPLAPIVLQSHYNEYFCDPRCADPFMLKIARVNERCRRQAPAVVHVDGTARVQVVPDDGDPFLVELLSAFHQETGVGVLLNTSFNRRGEPIVESPLDAIDAFLHMRLDGLYLEGEFYRPITLESPST